MCHPERSAAKSKDLHFARCPTHNAALIRKSARTRTLLGRRRVRPDSNRDAPPPPSPSSCGRQWDHSRKSATALLKGRLQPCRKPPSRSDIPTAAGPRPMSEGPGSPSNTRNWIHAKVCQAPNIPKMSANPTNKTTNHARQSCRLIPPHPVYLFQDKKDGPRAIPRGHLF
jgi:hypothetical protein